jgi:hypothetical protein
MPEQEQARPLYLLPKLTIDWIGLVHHRDTESQRRAKLGRVISAERMGGFQYRDFSLAGFRFAKACASSG